MKRKKKTTSKRHESRSRSAKHQERAPAGARPRRGSGDREAAPARPSRGRPQKPSKTGILGRVQKNAKGFAFLIPTDPSVPDAYVGRDEAATLLNNDIVEFEMRQRGGRAFGEILRIVKRNQTTVFGMAKMRGRDLWCITNDGEAHMIKKSKHGPAAGDWVIARIEEYPSGLKPGVVVPTTLIGKILTPEYDNEIAIAKFSLPHHFPNEAYNDAEAMSEVADKEIANPKKRKDLRELPFVTIDGEDAKDFDDAVLVEDKGEGKGYILYVAIADVSFFVRPNSPLDKSARDRGTSVYFPGYVVPMLPEELSNDLCSLRPQTDKLVLVCEIHFHDNGDIEKSRAYPALIRTARRLTYTQVHQYFNNDAEVRKDLEFLSTPLNSARALFKKMEERRAERGVLDFQLPEPKIKVDDAGNPVDVVRAPHFESHKLIEEFMIAANREIAKALRKSNTPSLYRVHEPPNPEKLEDVRQLLKTLGINARIDDPTPLGFSKVLAETKNVKGATTLHTAILRLQKQARYSPEPKGHFGLALEDYTHFTSPIRRYPDLIVHRALRRMGDRGKGGYVDPVDELGVETSEKERRATEAERWIVKRKQCWYLKDRVGQEFAGSVTGLISAGVFVTIDAMASEGFIPVEMLGGLWEFDEVRQQMRARPGHDTLSLGDAINIEVVEVSIDDNEITFRRAGTD